MVTAAALLLPMLLCPSRAVALYDDDETRNIDLNSSSATATSSTSSLPPRDALHTADVAFQPATGGASLHGECGDNKAGGGDSGLILTLRGVPNMTAVVVDPSNSAQSASAASITFVSHDALVQQELFPLFAILVTNRSRHRDSVNSSGHHATRQRDAVFTSLNLLEMIAVGGHSASTMQHHSRGNISMLQEMVDIAYRVELIDDDITRPDQELSNIHSLLDNTRNSTTAFWCDDAMKKTRGVFLQAVKGTLLIDLIPNNYRGADRDQDYIVPKVDSLSTGFEPSGNEETGDALRNHRSRSLRQMARTGGFDYEARAGNNGSSDAPHPRDGLVVRAQGIISTWWLGPFNAWAWMCCPLAFGVDWFLPIPPLWSGIPFVSWVDIICCI